MPIIYGIAFSCIFPSLVEARTGAAPGLVINSDVAKEIGHGLAIVDSSDGLRENQTDIHSLYLGALQLLYLVRNCVGYYHLWSARKKRPLAVPLIHSFSLKSWLTPRVVCTCSFTVQGEKSLYVRKKDWNKWSPPCDSQSVEGTGITSTLQQPPTHRLTCPFRLQDLTCLLLRARFEILSP